MASWSPSPITTVPAIGSTSMAFRIASTAAMSAAVSSPRPMSRAEPRAAEVPALVRRLDVQEEEVALGERPEPVLGLRPEVRVEVAGRAGHRDAVQAGEHAETVHEVDGGDDGAVDAEPLAQRREPRPLALSPEPDRGGRALAAYPPLLTARVLGEERSRALDQIAQHVRARPVGKGAADRLVGQVVRRRRPHPALALPPDEEMPIGEPGMQLETVAPEGGSEVGDDR